jgi:hypothetical protein
MQVNRELLEVHERLAEATKEWEAAGTDLATLASGLSTE